MLKTPVIHPDVLAALAEIGHGSRIVIGDGNFPHATATPGDAHRVFLNYAPGVLRVTDVLGPLLESVPVEAAAVMQPLREGPYAMASDPPIFAEFEAMLRPAGVASLDRLERFDFYDAARSPDVGLMIATGEQRVYANLLLTVGVVKQS